MTDYNPYSQDDDAPFAGRQAVFNRLYGHLTDPAQTHAMLVVGRQRIGKTVLLRQFGKVFDDSFIAVPIALRALHIKYESNWLMALVNAALNILNQREFNLARLTPPPVADDELRIWLSDTRLPEIFNIIRAHRRLVFLLDDAEALIDAIVAGSLPMDSFSYLHHLLQTHPQLDIVLTLNTRYEDNLGALSPLSGPVNVVRLNALTLEETTELLRLPNAQTYKITDTVAKAVQQATGGIPHLVQQFGFLLYAYWQKNGEFSEINPSLVKSLIPHVYEESEEDFKIIWHDLSRDERLVLTAISSLLYDDPLRKIDTDSIENWLVETDYPADAVAINAALRGLEYNQIVAHTPAGISVEASLMQKWLLENARIDDGRPSAIETRRYRVWLALGFILLMVVLVALVLAVPRAAKTPPPDAEPTVTLQPR